MSVRFQSRTIIVDRLELADRVCRLTGGCLPRPPFSTDRFAAYQQRITHSLRGVFHQKLLVVVAYWVEGSTESPSKSIRCHPLIHQTGKPVGESVLVRGRPHHEQRYLNNAFGSRRPLPHIALSTNPPASTSASLPELISKPPATESAAFHCHLQHSLNCQSQNEAWLAPRWRRQL